MSWLTILFIILIIIALLFIINYIFGNGTRPRFKGVDFRKIDKYLDAKSDIRYEKDELVDDTEEQKSISEQISEFSEQSRADFYQCKRPYVGKSSRGQKACRDFLQSYFGLPFLSCRPHFLLNPETDRFLEYDCYEGAVSLKQGDTPIPLAVEYQGEAHYHYIPHFHKSYDNFIEQQRRDEFKTEMSSKLGVYLIRVPYSVPLDQIPLFIKDRLPRNLIKEE